jgi:hypothetical protein
LCEEKKCTVSIWYCNILTVFVFLLGFSVPSCFSLSSLPFIFFRKRTFCKPNIYLTREFCYARSERRRLEEELMEVNNKVAELTSETGAAAIQRLQDEIKDCKSILKCSVCSDRPKEVRELSGCFFYHLMTLSLFL